MKQLEIEHTQKDHEISSVQAKLAMLQEQLDNAVDKLKQVSERCV